MNDPSRAFKCLDVWQTDKSPCVLRTTYANTAYTKIVALLFYLSVLDMLGRAKIPE